MWPETLSLCYRTVIPQSTIKLLPAKSFRRGTFIAHLLRKGLECFSPPPLPTFPMVLAGLPWGQRFGGWWALVKAHLLAQNIYFVPLFRGWNWAHFKCFSLFFFPSCSWELFSAKAHLVETCEKLDFSCLIWNPTVQISQNQVQMVLGNHNPCRIKWNQHFSRYFIDL